MSVTRHLLVLLAAGATILAGGCGIPTDASPRAITDDPPEALTDDTAPPTASQDATARRINLYFVGSDNILVRVERPVDTTPDAAGRVVELLGGITEAETRNELSSAIPQDTQLLESSITDDVITLDLSNQIETIEDERLIQAYAQIVYTATDQGTAKRVRFFIEGEPRDVPTDEGNLGEVSNRDYFSLAPEN